MDLLQKLLRNKKLLIMVGALTVLLVLILLLTRSCGKEDAADDIPPDDGTTVLIPTDEILAMEYYNGTAFLSFGKNEEDKWFWTQDPLFPLDESYPAKVAAAVQGLSATAVTEAGKTLESYGLDSSDLYIKTTAVGGKTSTLLIGNKLESGEYYVRFEDSEEVYVVGADLMAAVKLDINDMALIAPFPLLDETTISSLTLAGTGEESVTYNTKEESEGVYNWYQAGRPVENDAALASLLKEVAALQFDSCVDYHPSKEALEICGITAPMATLTVEYTAEGLASQLQLIIGNLREDGTTHFASLAADGTIYSIAHDSVENLLSVAETFTAAEESE